MDETIAEPVPVAPRVNHAMLRSYVGRTVTLVGRVESSTASAATIRAADGSAVVVTLHAGSFMPSTFVEIVGTVLDENSMMETRTCSFGEKFDLELYNQFLVLAEGKYRDLFQ